MALGALFVRAARRRAFPGLLDAKLLPPSPCVRVVAASTPLIVACPWYPGEPREASPWLAEAKRGVPGGGALREVGVQEEETDRLWKAPQLLVASGRGGSG